MITYMLLINDSAPISSFHAIVSNISYFFKETQKNISVQLIVPDLINLRPIYKNPLQTNKNMRLQTYKGMNAGQEKSVAP